MGTRTEQRPNAAFNELSIAESRLGMARGVLERILMHQDWLNDEQLQIMETSIKDVMAKLNHSMKLLHGVEELKLPEVENAANDNQHSG